MSIIGNIQNNIVVMYEIKSFYVTLEKTIKQITILPLIKIEKTDNTTVPPLGGIVYLKNHYKVPLLDIS
jgi:hypothetical protein